MEMGKQEAPTKTDRIRELYLQGKSISEIARELGIRYQHAYNTLVRLGLHKPKTNKQARSAHRVDPQVYSEFIRGIELAGVTLRSVEAAVDDRPAGRLGFEITMEPAENKPRAQEGGFVSRLRFRVRFLVSQDGEKERSFGHIEAVWEAFYRSKQMPSGKIYELFLRQNVPLNLWPYFRTQVDQLTAQMGLPRLVLPAFKTLP